jgi:hypothetical protein
MFQGLESNSAATTSVLILQQLEREKDESFDADFKRSKESLDWGYIEAGAPNSFSHTRALNHLSSGIPLAIYHVTKTGNRILHSLHRQLPQSFGDNNRQISSHA